MSPLPIFARDLIFGHLIFNHLVSHCRRVERNPVA